jgi:hypothetical protein
VFEQRAKPDPEHRILDRSYHLGISHRGMGAVEQAWSLAALGLIISFSMALLLGPPHS